MSAPARSIVCFALLLVFAPAGVWGQPPPPPASPLPGQTRDRGVERTGTSALAGRVTAFDTGRPIRRAQVRAFGPDVAEGKAVSTDEEGRWSLNELPAGQYSITVTKAGYVPLSYGQRRPFESGITVTLAEGQTLEKLDVALPRAGAIEGRVVDKFGESVSGVRVTANRYRFIDGQRRLVSVGSPDTTDDRGLYRLHGLPPGEYYVAAAPPTAGVFVATQDRSGYTQTFHPDAHSPAAAARLSLALGQELSEVGISLAPTRLAKLSGTAADSTGKPLAQGFGTLQERGPADLARRTSFEVLNGAWSVSGVVPGEYTLRLQLLPQRFEEIALTGRVGATSELAEVPITVTGDDISGIALVTAPLGTVKGRVRFEDEPLPSDALNAAFIRAYEPEEQTPPGGGRVAADGTFEVGALSGTRIFRTSGFPPGWILKSITLEGDDVTDTAIPIRLGSTISRLEVTMTRRAAELSGGVQTANGTPSGDYVVVLFAPEPERWGAQSRFVRTARPDQTGRFVIGELPPASYLAVALEYVEPGEETNPEFLERLKGSATKITVAAGEKKTITLTLTTGG